MTDIPIIMGPQGPVPQQPAALLAQLLAAVAAVNPGYTANLPGSLVEDISSTDTYALLQCDSEVVDLINSITPYGSNQWLLIQQGNLVGVQQGAATNTSVYCVFTGTPGYIIAQGLVVSDGTHQYTVQNGGVVTSSGLSSPIYCLATSAGSWPVPANSVNQILSSIPTGYTLTVTNPSTGIPGGATETAAAYRIRVAQAWLAASQGMARYLKTLLGQVAGVQARLINPIQLSGQGWEIIVGGGDPYEVANAIYTSLFDINALQGSQLLVAGITQANPGVVTTTLNHGYATGQVINIAGVVGMTAVNNTPLTVTVISLKTFSIGVNTSSYGAYVSGGLVTPNFRNVVASIIDFPDTYAIPFVVPPQQSVAIAVTWNTNSVAFVNPLTVSQLTIPALVNYVNGIYAGQPMNLFAMEQVFQVALATVVPSQLLTRMVFAVSINGIGVSPSTGTGIIAGDPESYFLTSAPLISVTQG